MSSSSGSPNLLDCNPEDLATYLLNERFNTNTKDTASFLLRATSSLPNAEELSAELLLENNNTNDEQKEEEINMDELLMPPLELSMIQPSRGRFTSILMKDDGMHCVNTKKREDFKVVPSNVANIIIFPKAEDILLKKKGNKIKLMVLVALKENILFGIKKKSIRQVCFNMPDEESTITTTFLDNFRTCLGGNITIHRVLREDKGWVFRSYNSGTTSTTTAGMPFVKCFHGLNDGYLYPLEIGLLFFKPTYFVPRDKLHSIACGRGGSSATSRYVDMMITLSDDDDDKSLLQFTNIHREELNVLNNYIHKILIPAMKKDVDDNKDGEETESDDEDHEEDITVKRTNSSSRGRTKRKAATEARHATKLQLKKKKKENESDDEEEDDDDDDDSDEEYMGGNANYEDDDVEIYCNDDGNNKDNNATNEKEEDTDDEDEDEDTEDKLDGDKDDDNDVEIHSNGKEVDEESHSNGKEVDENEFFEEQPPTDDDDDDTENEK